MLQKPLDWIQQRRPSGNIVLAGVTIRVSLQEAETIGERMAICTIEGDLAEADADRIALAEYRARHQRQQS